MNNRETQGGSPDSAIRKPRARSASANARQTTFAGASRPPTGKDALFAANRGRQRHYAYYAIYIRRNNKGPGIAEAFDAGLQQSLIHSPRRPLFPPPL